MSMNANRQRRIRSEGKMLHTSLFHPQRTMIRCLSFEGAVDPVQQTEVPPNLHVNSPICQQLHGMCHHVRAMAVTRQTKCTTHNRSQETLGAFRCSATELNASCDERSSHHGSMRACNPFRTEPEDVIYIQSLITNVYEISSLQSGCCAALVAIFQI